MGAGRFREAFMRHVGGRHASLAAAAARVIAGFLLNRATDDDLLDEAGQRPPKRQRGCCVRYMRVSKRVSSQPARRGWSAQPPKCQLGCCVQDKRESKRVSSQPAAALSVAWKVNV